MRKEQRNSYILVVFLFASLLTLAIETKPSACQTGTVWTVDDDGSADFHMIQAAVNAASDGDTIRVLSGVYHEHLTVDKQLSIEGESNFSSVITGDNSQDVVSVMADYASLSHLVIEGSGEFCAGLFLDSCKAAYLNENLIENNDNGVTVANCLNAVVSNNVFKSNLWDGITIRSSSQTIVSNNTAVANGNSGLTLLECKQSVITGNTFKSNFYGIYLYESNSTSIFGNAIIGNQQQTRIISTRAGTKTSWNRVFPEGGNYWGDYNGTDMDHDALGDTPFLIDENNSDHYPLMGTLLSYNISTESPIEIVSNSTIDDFQCFESNQTIIMHVTNTSNEQNFGFCRISIPHDFMNETYSVTIEGTQPYTENLSIYDNGTYHWIYFSYRHSTLEIVVIPEVPHTSSMLFLLLMAVSFMIYHKRSTAKRI